MSEFAVFDVAPRFRCFQATSSAPAAFCGREAVMFRPGSAYRAPGFYCALHGAIGDSPIPPDALFRRVRVTCEVYLAGVTQLRTLAHAEAIGTLERLVEQAGGLLNVFDATSSVGRAAAQPAGGDVILHGPQGV